MIKLIAGAVFLVVAGVVWIRSRWAREKNQGTSKRIVEELRSGKFVIESYAGSLDITICTKTTGGGPDPATVKQRLNALNETKLNDKYHILYADFNEHHHGIVVGEAASKDVVAMPGANQEIDLFYPCWLYLDAESAPGEIKYKSVYPENKDHHYLLEDLATVIHNRCISSGFEPA